MKGGICPFRFAVLPFLDSKLAPIYARTTALIERALKSSDGEARVRIHGFQVTFSNRAAVTTRPRRLFYGYCKIPYKEICIFSGSAMQNALLHLYQV